MGGAKYYIIFKYFKYIFFNILVFIGLIWVSQILRILELQYSISNQIFDVIKTTSLVLPSFINPLMPFLLLLSSFVINYKLNSNNEITIIKQYFSLREISYLLFSMMTLIFLFYFFNNEILSVNTYHKYKIGELEIRNNLKLGSPSKNELHVENEVSIFFEHEKNNIFHNLEALIFQEGQFIKSEYAEIEVSKKNFNLIFYNGERLLLNDIEKSKTNFDKFTYSIEDKSIEQLLMDKEHYNTLELIKHHNKDFVSHAHNRIYQYILTIVIIFLSFKIIFLYEPKKIFVKKFGIIFLFFLFLQIINAYFIYLINNINFDIYIYYFLNFCLLLLFSFFLIKLVK